MAIALQLKKEGDAPKPNIMLNLKKAERFMVELYWDDGTDLDAHALLAINNGGGAKVSESWQILSTFNEALPLADGSSMTRKSGDKRPFKTPEGALHHSGDARTGIGAAVDEIITIDGTLIPTGVNEIPIFVTIYPNGSANFGSIKLAGIRIKNSSGKVLGEYELTHQYATFNAVQMGTLILGPSGWEYTAVGSGFNGDFGKVIEFFS